MRGRGHATVAFGALPLVSALVLGWLTACQPEAPKPQGPPLQGGLGETLHLGNRRIDALITCYKVIILAQDRYGGTGAPHDGIAGSLEAARSRIEARLVANLTAGAEKARANERIELQLQSLLEAKPYTSSQLLLDTARACAERERKNTWAELP